jgi:hypothetical protein
MNMETPSILRQTSRIRTKTNVDVELIMADGTTLSGSVFIGLEERVQELLNDSKQFFPLRLENKEVLLINKTMVAICKPLPLNK